MPRPRPRCHDCAELASDLPRLADLIAERLDARTLERSGWVGSDVVANHLGVDVSYVYQHAAELGARRLGTGPKARLRFRLDLVDEALRTESGALNDQKAGLKPTGRGRPRTRPSTNVPLLPIRRARSSA